jgi:Leucine-rich repeat (LRR) protein
MKKLYPLLFISVLICWGCEEEHSDEHDTTPPTVFIQSPITNNPIFEIVTIVVETNDNVGISKVEFYVDDSLVLTDTESPYEYDWNTTEYEDDSEHIVKVISYDTSDNSTPSQPISYLIDNSGSRPTPSELYPITYDNGFQISWSQNNDDDFQSYKLYESPFEDMSNKILIYETENISDITFIKSFHNFIYHQIVVEDVWGLQSISNIEVGDYEVELWGEYYSVLNTIYLDLTNSGLTGLIPPEIGNLTNLTELNLHYNDLSNSIPPEIGNLTNLTYLKLTNNDFTGSIPSEIGNLTNLTHLYLLQNQLTGEIPPEIGNLTNLIYLDSQFNQLTGSIPPEIGNLTNLQILGLYGNELTGSIPPEIGNLTNLEWLYLSNNQLTGSIPPEIGNLTNLTVLDFDGNQLTGSIPSEIGNLTNLAHLWLNDNQLTGSIPPEIGNLTNLTGLDLYDNQLTGSIPPEIGNLTNLWLLSLYNNDLTGSIPPEIGNLTNLNELMLSGNQLTGIIPDEICNQGDSSPVLSNNQLCPPYPSCIENYVEEQDTSDCD